MLTPILVRLRLADLSGRILWKKILAVMILWILASATFGVLGYLIGASCD